MAEKRFSEETKVRMPPALNEALDRAVQARCTTKSDYVRTAILQQLEADGMPFTAPKVAS
jgi:predicted DNA-binding protein